MSGYKRCTNCNIAPLPWDVPYFWGNTEAELRSERCLLCQGKPYKLTGRERDVQITHDSGIHGCQGRPRGRAVVVLVDKLVGLPTHLLEEPLLGLKLRDLLRLREYHSDCFLTDGERGVWKWIDFPGNRDTPMDWDEFLETHPEWDLYEPTDYGMRLVEAAEDEAAVDDSAQAVTVPVVTYTPFNHVKM